VPLTLRFYNDVDINEGSQIRRFHKNRLRVTGFLEGVRLGRDGQFPVALELDLLINERPEAGFPFAYSTRAGA
jgi:hypothetical protein